jgi:hypothetical protein
MSLCNRITVFWRFPPVMIILFLMIFISGCHKDDLLFEIPPSGTDLEINQVVDSIEFKFCLLDEEGNPSTTFQEKNPC